VHKLFTHHMDVQADTNRRCCVHRKGGAVFPKPNTKQRIGLPHCLYMVTDLAQINWSLFLHIQH